jgi:hypothetical protein
MVRKQVPSMLLSKYFQNLGSDVVWLPCIRVQECLSFHPGNEDLLQGPVKEKDTRLSGFRNSKYENGVCKLFVSS